MPNWEFGALSDRQVMVPRNGHDIHSERTVNMALLLIMQGFKCEIKYLIITAFVDQQPVKVIRNFNTIYHQLLTIFLLPV